MKKIVNYCPISCLPSYVRDGLPTSSRSYDDNINVATCQHIRFPSMMLRSCYVHATSMGAGRGSLRVARGLLRFIFQCLGDCGLQFRNTVLVSGMGREKFGLFGTSRACHSTPECHSLVRIVACHGHENQAQAIGFILVFPGEGQSDA